MREAGKDRLKAKNRLSYQRDGTMEKDDIPLMKVGQLQTKVDFGKKKTHRVNSVT